MITTVSYLCVRSSIVKRHEFSKPFTFNAMARPYKSMLAKNIFPLVNDEIADITKNIAEL